MLKKIGIIFASILVVAILYLGYDYIDFDNFSFLVFLAGFLFLVMQILQVRDATIREGVQIDLITVIMAIVFICLFVAFGFIFKSL